MTGDGDTLFERLRAAAGEGLAPNLRRFLAFRGMRDGEPVELQAIGVPNGRFPVNRFAHARTVDEAVEIATVADGWGAPGVYVIGNSIDPAVATRAEPGKWHDAKKGEATSDSEIRARRLLYLDFDAVRPKATSSTRQQVIATLDVADRFAGFAGERLGHDTVAIGCSGNGASVFVALDEIQESDQLDSTVKGILAATKAVYESNSVAVDVSVCDPKRLMPCFGTIKRKGAPNVPDRPHRRTTIVTPENARRISFDALTGLLGALANEVPRDRRPEIDKAMGKRAQPAARTPTDTRSPFDVANERCDVRSVAAKLGLADGESVRCPGCSLGGAGDSSVAYVGNGVKCSHNRCASKGRGNGFRSIVDMVCEVKGLGLGESLHWLADEFGFSLPERAKPQQHARPRPPQPKFQAVPDRLTGEREERIDNGRRSLSFGVKFLDQALGGIFPRDMILLGAKTGVGKTALATTVALHNAVNLGKRVHYFALEAEDKEIERRMKFQLVSAMFYQDGGDFARTEIRYLDWYAGKLEHVLGKYEARADVALRKGLATLHTFYRDDDFTVDDFEAKMDEIETDLIVLDHFHYLDDSDDRKTENESYKRKAKKIRTAALRKGKPTLLVAHVRKGDRRFDALVPSIDDFHGSSDIPKIATKAVMIAPAFDQPNERPFLWNTYVQIAKCRLDGALTRYTALCTFNSRTNIYENDYTLGKLIDGGKKFEAVNTSQLPGWAKEHS